MIGSSNPSSTFQSAAGHVLLGKRSNCLLVKDDVGRSKPTTRKLPSETHMYGKACPKNIESAGAGNVPYLLVLNLNVLQLLLTGEPTSLSTQTKIRCRTSLS
jgi:hypothetical protein